MLLTLLALIGCPYSPEPAELPVVAPAPLLAGAAEGTLDLPIGTPQGCYSARCIALGSTSYQDSRHSPYNTSFVESTGIHTRPVIKALWLENTGGTDTPGDHLVVIKTDLCMSSDHLLTGLTEELNALTGLDLTGKIALSVSHSHASYGAYQDSWHFLLGTDRLNEEIRRRSAQQLAQVAFEAKEKLEPAAIGAAWVRDWDPNDRVYSDRRGANNELQVWPDQEAWVGGKDPHAHSLRVDRLNGEPIAWVVTFGMHGIIESERSALVSRDSSGGLEDVLQEYFPGDAVVMHLQGNGGDASPRGRDDEHARNETIGELAKDALLDLYEATPTAANPVRIETASRAIWQHHSQIRVTRNGTTDFHYKPLVPDAEWRPDNIIYDENGAIIQEIDEFNAPYGAAFCGGNILLPAGLLGADVYPYDSCTRADLLGDLLRGIFKYGENDIPLPFPEVMKASTMASRLGPIPTLGVDGNVSDQDLFVGFFPGEPLAMYGEQWRRRVKAELGHEMALLVGYSQDHEGYLLIPEDWLSGGYEASINVWGPLQGEHIMEGVLAYGDSVLGTDVYEDPDPLGRYAPTEHPHFDLPELYGTPQDENRQPMRPDPTPEAGTRLTELPEYFWVPREFRVDEGDGWRADVQPIPAEVPRVSGLIQIAWEGGDPMVDPPHVYLERQAEDGSWSRATTTSGRDVSEALTDILVGYTPFPLFPATAPQRHYYWAAWQAVGDTHTRASLPLGTYRLKVEGLKWGEGPEVHWPWTSAPYELATEPFEVVPAELRVEEAEGGAWLSMDAPGNGWRLVDLDGSSTGANPVRGEIQVSLDGGAPVAVPVERVEGGRAFVPVDLSGAGVVTFTDAHGNKGTLNRV